MKKLIVHILFFLFLLFTYSAGATELKFDGSIGYKFDKDKVTIFADKIMNKSPGGKSGSIKVALYATESPYEMGGLYGYVLGEHTFDKQLYGRYNFVDVQQTVNYVEPPIGKYYITVALLEYDGNDFKLTDYASFKQPVLFGLEEDIKKELDLKKKKDQEIADQDQKKEDENKKKKEDEYSFKDDLTTQTLLTVLVLGGLRHMISVP